LDVIDAEDDTFVGRVPGFAGVQASGNGPNGVLVTPSRKAWVGDGNATVQVADVDPASASYLKIIKTIDVSIATCSPNCNRTDEGRFGEK
jgi:hypothetical protein